MKTDLLMGSFIDILRNKAAVMQLGATFLPGLVGKVEIPRQSGVSATQWIQETGTVTGSNATFDKVALDMKTIAAKSFVSRNHAATGDDVCRKLRSQRTGNVYRFGD